MIDGKDNLPFAADEGDALAQVPGVKSASHVRSDTVLVDGKERKISGIDPATIAHFYDFTWVKGSEQSLGKLGIDGAVVKKSYADDKQLKIGSSIAITMPSGAKRTLVVRGIHKNKTELLGDISMTQQGFDKASHEPKNSLTFLDAGPAPRRRSRPRSAATATPRSTRAPASPRTRPSSSRRCWRCSTCCSASPWSSACSGWSTRSCSRCSSARVRSGCSGRSA